MTSGDWFLLGVLSGMLIASVLIAGIAMYLKGTPGKRVDGPLEGP